MKTDLALLTDLADLLRERGWMLATAESCTGGLIAARCTDVAGSSLWFDCGFVTYSNAAKCEMLGVDEALIAQHGAVSEVVARAMARGAAARSTAQATLAVTGIAGPTGGSADKPVGTVWFGFHVQGSLHSEVRSFQGGRTSVREQAASYALQRILQLLRNGSQS